MADKDLIFHYLTLIPNVCAVYTDEGYRRQGTAGRLLALVVSDLKLKGISPVYLVTDHTAFTKGTVGNFSAWCKVTANRI